MSRRLFELLSYISISYLHKKVIELNEFARMLANFDKLPTEKRLEFMEHYTVLKNEFKVISEENNILKKGLSEVRRVSS